MMSFRTDPTVNKTGSRAGPIPPGSEGLLDSSHGLFFHPVRDAVSASHKRPKYPQYKRREGVRDLSRTFDLDLRVAKCGYPSPRSEGVDLRRYDTGKVGVSGTLYCGNAHQCPVCRVHIASGRQQEIEKALLEAQQLGWHAYFLTLTLPHGLSDRLQVLWSELRSSYGRLFGGRNATWIKAQGYQGRISSFDVTHGGTNGWHPHLHVLIFFDRPVPESFQRELFRLWEKALAKHDRLPNESAFRFLSLSDNLQETSRVAAYMSKGSTEELSSSPWSVADELTASHVKNSDSGLTVDQLIDSATAGYAEALDLLLEYFDASKGRQLISWSKGLKALLSVHDRTDEEILEEREKQGVLLGTLTHSQWVYVIETYNETRLLQAATQYGFLGALRVVAEAKAQIMSRRRSVTA